MAIKSVFFLVFLLTAASAQAVTFVPERVAPDVYAFIGDTGPRTYENEGMNANAGFIVTPAGVVVVDSGSSWQVARAMHEAIRQITSQPVKYVVNTGGQDHRWLGNGYFRQQGAEIIASRKARSDMEERGAAQLDELRKTIREKADGTWPVYPERLFDSDETLMLGGVEIHIHHYFGGHTPGDAVVWLPRWRVLFSGDLAYTDRLLSIAAVSNTRSWLASFDELERLNPEWIVPGHGKVSRLDQVQRETRDYLVLLRSHMKKALDDGLDLQTAIDSLDQSPFSYLANHEQLKGANASRVYLEMENE